MNIPCGSPDLAYHREGRGIPCVVFRAPGTQLMERTLSPHLRDHLEFIFIDPSVGIPVEAALDEVEALRSTLGIERVAVLSHSAPGLLALEYSLRFPEHTSHVILIGCPSRLDDPDGRIAQYWDQYASPERKRLHAQTQARLPEVLASLTPSAAFVASYVHNSPLYWYDAQYDCSALWEGAVIIPEDVTYFFTVAMKDRATVTRLSTGACPVFLALGRYDFAVPPTVWEEPAKHLPQVTRHVFERSGHYPHFEEPAAFDAALMDWLHQT